MPALFPPTNMTNRAEAQEPALGQVPAQERRSRWRKVALVTSSALLSGIAVVLWNRHALQRMRNTPGKESWDATNEVGISGQNEEEREFV